MSEPERYEVVEFVDLFGKKRYKVCRGGLTVHSEWTGAIWKTRFLRRARRLRDAKNKAIGRATSRYERVVE